MIPTFIPSRFDVIQVPFVDFEADWKTAKESLNPFPGYVYVQMAPYEESKCGVLRTDETMRRSRADVAVVLAVGKDREEDFIGSSGDFEKPLPLEVKPGDRVLVDPKRGDSFEGFQVGGFRTKSVVRVYGDCSRNEFIQRGRQVDECIVALVEERMLRPVGRMVLLKRDPLKEGSVALLDKDKERPPFGVILESSELAKKHGRLPGMRVQYRQACSHALKTYELELGENVLDYPIEDLALVPYENITSEV